MISVSRKTARTGIVLALLYASLVTLQAQTATSRIVSAANTFLSTLNDKQRQSVLFAFDDAKQRANWSNLPTVMVPRSGISLKEMSATQRAAAMALLSSALSPRGFEKVQQIMEGDEINKNTDAGPPRGGNNSGGPPPGGSGNRARFGNGPIFGKDLYFVSFLGKPSEKDPWMLQFGGHHLALNITIAAEHGVLTPTLTG